MSLRSFDDECPLSSQNETGGGGGLMFVLVSEYSNSSPHMLNKYLARHHYQGRAANWGCVWVTRRPTRIWDGEIFGLDNGAFSAFRKGAPFPESRFLKMVDKALDETPHSCVIAVCPDIVAGGNQSLEFSLMWRERLPDELPWFLAVQDGMFPSSVEDKLNDFAGIFLGGTNSFKATAYKWCELARAKGKLFHFGRASTLGRVRAARSMGADSLDSASPVLRWRFGRKQEANGWVKEALGNNPQMTLGLSGDVERDKILESRFIIDNLKRPPPTTWHKE